MAQGSIGMDDSKWLHPEQQQDASDLFGKKIWITHIPYIDDTAHPCPIIQEFLSDDFLMAYKKD